MKAGGRCVRLGSRPIRLADMVALGQCLAPVIKRVLTASGAAVLISALLCLDSGSRAEEAPRRVLMLHAFNYTFPATTIIAEAARKRLIERSARKIEIDAEFLDLVRGSDLARELLMVHYLREKYLRAQPDVVMTLGSAALPFIVKHRDLISPKVPVVFSAVSPSNHSSSQAATRRDGHHQRVRLRQDARIGRTPSARRKAPICDCGKRPRRSSVARNVSRGLSKGADANSKRVICSISHSTN